MVQSLAFKWNFIDLNRDDLSTSMHISERALNSQINTNEDRLLAGIAVRIISSIVESITIEHQSDDVRKWVQRVYVSYWYNPNQGCTYQSNIVILF